MPTPLRSSSGGADIRAICTAAILALHRAVRARAPGRRADTSRGGIPVNQKSHGENPAEIAQHDEDHELICAAASTWRERVF